MAVRDLSPGLPSFSTSDWSVADEPACALRRSLTFCEGSGNDGMESQGVALSSTSTSGTRLDARRCCPSGQP